MSDTSSVPGIQWTPTGLVLPTEAEILAGAQADMNAAFGGNMNPALQTPQGQFASSETAIIADKNAAIAQLVDQVDPDNATGFMQDAIGRIYFMNRNPGTPTTVQVLCVGQLGTTIQAGTAQVQDTSGNIYVCQQTGQIPVGGSITLPFANVVLGPVPCPEDTVTIIYQAGPLGAGWDTCNNAAAGIEGSNVETAAAFEFRRQNSVAANAHGSLPSIYAAVFDVDDVIDCYVYENVTDNPIYIGSTNYELLPHSFFVGVIGGAAADIANAIWTKKNEGSNMNGNTSQTVTDQSGYSYPFPSYTIKYNNNAENAATINFVVNIVNSSNLPGTITTDVQGAITQQFNGVTNTPLASNGVTPSTSGQRARIGALLLAASYYGPVATCEGPSVPVQVLSIFIGGAFVGTGSVTNGSGVLTIGVVTSGAVQIGSVVTATGVPAGTTIVQQLSGSAGGVGTYQLSANATADESAEAVSMAGGTAQQIGIDQAPTLGTITVNLV
jgi:hypothetical protein